MRKFLLALAFIPGLLIATNAPAMAGSAHFVGTPTYTISGGTITVAAKEAGLGNLTQIHVVLSGVAQCVNPGSQEPSAQNKASFAVAENEPVQNGKSDYEISVTPVFQPSCSPPMTIAVESLTVADQTNGIAETPVLAP